MAVGLHIVARATVSRGADIPALVAAAGGQMLHARLEGDTLIVRGVEQSAMDAAVSAGVDELHGARQTKVAALDAELGKRIAAGMPYAGKLLQIGPEAQADMAAMSTAAVAGTLPTGFAWRMADNTFVPLDAPALIAMASAAMGYVYSLYAAYWQAKDAARTAANAAALAAINPAAGWPAAPSA